MEGNFINNIFSKVKNKFNNKKDYPHINDYSFSGEELDSLSKQNMEEIDKLRNGYKKESSVNKLEEVKEENVNNKEDNNVLIEEKVDNNVIVEEKIDDKVENKNIDTNKEESGYINLSSERRENIMKRWNSIDIVSLGKDINKGKDILDHNYLITYADDALSYIYKIRAEYDILIEYLIGFNNEKKGIYEKNIFSNRLDDEWKYLKNYVKVLEKIRGAINK